LNQKQRRQGGSPRGAAAGQVGIAVVVGLLPVTDDEHLTWVLRLSYATDWIAFSR
jgi:hypothetical protein